MGILGIDAVIFGVEDMAAARRFFTDWGLTRQSSSRGKAVFATQDNSQIVLRPAASRDLPPAIEAGSTVRELVWGVRSAADLKRIARELGKDREVAIDDNGVVHSTDPMGLAIAFRVTRRVAFKDAAALPMNSLARAQRIDAPARFYARATPTHIGHVVFFAPDIRAQESFYTKRLGFHVSDYYTGRGVFLRARQRGGHHNLFFLESESGKPGINHVAFGVRDIHELFAGGMHIGAKGWKTEIGPGRHHISSCYFWYFKNPCGGAAEYFYDEDNLTEKWKPRRWDPKPENFAEWVLPEGLVRSQALPPTREARDAKR
jgi:catechol 2,3-dioxygenase-like lactoylglutathione lyase family enzyme